MGEVHIPRDRSIPASFQFKNPGAMWPGAVASKWGSTKWQYLSDGTGQGGAGHGNKIAIFDRWVDGICAQLDLWRTSPNYRNKRFKDAINIWDGGNHTPDYIAHVKARVPGMNENTLMDDAFWRSPMAMQFLRVQAAHEAGRPSVPATDEDWAEAQRRVFTGKVPIPPAAKKTAAAVATVTTTTSAVAVHAVHSGWNPLWVVVLIAAGIGLTVLAAWFFHQEEE